MLHVSAGLLLGPFFDLEDGDDIFLRNIGFPSELHGVKAQKNILSEKIIFRK
jgi:hypothetical protein